VTCSDDHPSRGYRRLREVHAMPHQNELSIVFQQMVEFKRSVVAQDDPCYGSRRGPAGTMIADFRSIRS